MTPPPMSTAAMMPRMASLPPEPEAALELGPFSRRRVCSDSVPASGPAVQATVTLTSPSASWVTRIGTCRRSRPTGTS